MKRGKIKKGDFGYIRQQKLLRLMRTLACCLLPAAFFTVGMILNRGDRYNIYTVIALVGCIPVCMSLVSMIMMWLQKPMKQEFYQEISARAGDLVMAYELYMTTRDVSIFVDAAAVCGDYVAAYTDRPVKRRELDFMEEHITKTLRANRYKMTVKIFDQKKAFLERLDTLRARQAEFEAAAAEHFTPDEKYPDLSRSQLVKHMLLALSL